MASKLIEVRKQIKSRKPTYKRSQSNQFAKFKNDAKWRRPKGMGNKNRRNRKGHVGMLKVGFGSPKAVKGFNKDGFKEVVVNNAKELSNVNKNEVAVIASTVGGKKRIEILKAAKSAKIALGNVKDIDKTLKSLEKTKKKAPAKKVEEKKAEAKPKTEKKEEAKK